MRRALFLAARGQGKVEPNPMVGCVLVKGGKVVGQGYHKKYGGPHAEVNALRDAGGKAAGATAYVTLEPCSHFGKTPPCAQALVEAGVARVVGAHEDPFPQVSGRGFEILRKAGIEVESGLLAEDAAELNGPFLTRVLKKRPYVIAKWAQSLDGKIATRSGDSQWISGPASRRIVHKLRARVDGVMVGLQTAIKDDPQLTARDVSLKRVACRLVVDSQLRIPLRSKLVATAGEVPVVVLTTRRGLEAGQKRAVSLEKRGVEIIVCRESGGRVSLPDALRKLADRGLTNLLVEGGGELIGSLADDDLLDEAYVFTAPFLIGGREAPSGCGGRGISLVERAKRPFSVTSKTVNNDFLTIIRLTGALIC